MKRLVMCIVLLLPSLACAQEALFVMRHAEKADDGKDPPLSAAGERRAQALLALLRDAGVNAIYATEFVRTRATAEPLAHARKLEVRIASSKDTAALVKRLKAEHPSDRVLVVGHSNTVPEILVAYGATEKITLSDKDYDNLFVLVPNKVGPPTLIRMHF